MPTDGWLTITVELDPTRPVRMTFGMNYARVELGLRVENGRAWPASWVHGPYPPPDHGADAPRPDLSTHPQRSIR